MTPPSDLQALSDAATERLRTILAARLPDGAQWLRDDGYQSNEVTGSQMADQLAHLFATGDVVSGLPSLRAATPVVPADLDRTYKPAFTGLLSTMKGIARDTSVSSLNNARAVAERAVENAEEAVAEFAASPSPDTDAGLDAGAVVAFLDDYDGRVEDIITLWVQGKRTVQQTAETLVNEGHVARLTSEKGQPV